jgi:hypothetical protein
MKNKLLLIATFLLGVAMGTVGYTSSSTHQALANKLIAPALVDTETAIIQQRGVTPVNLLLLPAETGSSLYLPAISR